MICYIHMNLDRQQRKHLADKLMDSANVAQASLVVGQFVSRSIQWALVIVGLLFFVVAVVVTTKLSKGGR